MRILLVEDDQVILRLTAKVLIEAGYLVSMAASGDEGLRLGVAGGHDLALVDLELPSGSGIAIVRAMRDAGQTIPIIIFTGRGTDEDVVAGLDAGADDYLVKPVRVAVLRARVRAALRRRAEDGHIVLRMGDTLLDRRSRELTCAGELIPLTAQDFSLLEFFMMHPGEVVSRAELLTKVWGMDFDPGSNMMDAAMNRLRSKLRSHPRAPELTTVRGVGFMLGRSPPA